MNKRKKILASILLFSVIFLLFGWAIHHSNSVSHLVAIEVNSSYECQVPEYFGKEWECSLRAFFPEIQTVFVLDSFYVAKNESEWRVMLDSARVNSSEWRPSLFDCDDIAIVQKAYISERFRVNSIGIVFGKTSEEDYGFEHAFNIFYASDTGWHVYDPSSFQYDNEEYVVYTVIF